MPITSRRAILERIRLYGHGRGGDGKSLPDTASITSFQVYYGLNPDGIIGPATERAALLPRCGVLDAIRVGNICKWHPDTTHLRYAFLSYAPGPSPADWQSIARDATSQISSYCNLTFSQVDRTESPHFTIAADTRDGPSGILADAELCCGIERQRPTRLTFDNRESWDLTGRSGRIHAPAVFKHELLHILGSDHRPISEGPALLNPTYTTSVLDYLAWDISQVQLRYGVRSTPPPAPGTITLVIKGEVLSHRLIPRV